MRLKTFVIRSAGTAIAAALLAGAPGVASAQSRARVAELPSGTQRPTGEVLLSVGEGQMIKLPAAVSDVWVSNPGVADVYVTNSRQINLFGKGAGEATVFATSASGSVVYATNIRVAQNITSVDRMLKLAMPEADLQVTTAGQLAVLTGTVASPDDGEQAERLVKAMLNPGVDTSSPTAVLKMQVISRIRTATPLQVNLQVRIVEVSRELSKQVGFNLLTRDNDGIFGNGFLFNLTQGRNLGTIASSNGGTTYTFNRPDANVTSLGAAGKLFGIDVLAALDLAEADGVVTTLANPNLTALSGETASFLAGGEIPIPLAQTLGQVSIEYKQYGVSLAFTPTVLSDGRISMRVRPEVSQLSTAGAIELNNFQVPGITTRRAETTVELGSGQSFMIGGLLSNASTNNIDKAPFLGDLPILGNLFRSKRWQRSESELVIIVTPYLVKPVSANQIALPSDGYRVPTDAQNIVTGSTFEGRSGDRRPMPSAGAPRTVAPGIGAGAALDQAPAKAATSQTKGGANAQPGFSF